MVRIFRKLLTIVWCLVLLLSCLIGFLASDEYQGTLRWAAKIGFAIAGLGFVALAVWRVRRP